MKHRFESYPKQFYLGICHRGLHNEESSENGLKAFQNAIDNDMAFELDVHLSKDGVLFVSHDSNLKRMTGKEGIIEELDSSYIKSNYRLHDGGEVPTLQEVLDLNKERVLIVVEMKVVKNNFRAVAKATREILSQIEDVSKIAIISFDPRALKCVGNRFERQLLLLKARSWARCFRYFFESVDIECTMAKDNWVKRYRKHGGIVNCWTVETEKQVKDLSDYVDTMTFQGVSKDIVIENRKNYLKKRP